MIKKEVFIYLKFKNKKLDKTTIEKTINRINFRIKVYEVNEPVRHYDYIKNTAFIFIIFDFLSRESFEDIVEIWKVYLIDTVGYSNKLFLLGNYFKEGEKLTEKNEIDELLKEIEEEKGVKIEYFDIGAYQDQKLVELFDDKIYKMYLEMTKNSKSSKSNHDSGSCSAF